MTKLRADYLTRFKPSGEEALADKPMSFYPKTWINMSDRYQTELNG